MADVKIIAWDCYDDHGARYNQYDVVVDGVADTDTAWCDSLEEAENEALKISGVSETWRTEQPPILLITRRGIEALLEITVP